MKQINYKANKKDKKVIAKNDEEQKAIIENMQSGRWRETYEVMNIKDLKDESPSIITFRPSKKNIGLLSELSQLAKNDNRNLNNYIETILLNHVKASKKL
jgi:hypothetical protein